MIRSLSKSYPELKIVVLSGLDPDVFLDARLLGASTCLSKPVRAEIVVECVRQQLMNYNA